MPAPVRSEELWVCQLGLVEYTLAMAAQERVRGLRQEGQIPDTLLMLEHPPVYTRGRRSLDDELPMGDDWYRAQGIDVVATDRGGRVTYHGPGQLVGYPIMLIDDVIVYLRTMEGAIIATLADVGIDARVREGLTGVWVADQKIASIGVHVSRGVTTHGLAINVENDLEPFSWVVPCGLTGVAMTSVSHTRAETVSVDRVGRAFVERFAQAHGRQRRPVAPDRLGLDLAPTGLASSVGPAASTIAVPA
jgi:lipoyl(octanoyl) transferase